MDVNDNFLSVPHTYKFLSAYIPWTSTITFCQCYTHIYKLTMDGNDRFLSVLHTYTNSCQYTNHGPQHQLSVSATHLCKFWSAHKPWTSTITFCQWYTATQIPFSTHTTDVNNNILSALHMYTNQPWTPMITLSVLDTYTNSCQHTVDLNINFPSALHTY